MKKQQGSEPTKSPKRLQLHLSPRTHRILKFAATVRDGSIQDICEPVLDKLAESLWPEIKGQMDVDKDGDK